MIPFSPIYCLATHVQCQKSPKWGKYIIGFKYSKEILMVETRVLPDEVEKYKQDIYTSLDSMNKVVIIFVTNLQRKII